jgi:putative spermidine/putrescine transport system substrate-binding protein
LQPITVLWDGQVYDVDAWVMAKGTRAKSAEFIAYATRPDRLAEQARLFPYGPMRRSAVNLVAAHPKLGIDMRAHLPTEPANLAGALRSNAAWWSVNEAAMDLRLEQTIAAANAPPAAPAKPVKRKRKKS